MHFEETQNLKIMASRREVRCRCGRQMWVHPEIRAVQCSNCYTVTQLYSLLDTAHGGNHMVHGFQQPRRKQQQQPQMMAQPPSPRQYHEEEQQQQPPMTMTQPPSPRQHKYHEEQEPQMMTQPPPQHQYHEQPQQMMMTQLPPRRQYHEEQEPQMMTQPSPQHQYPEQQPQMMIDRPPPKRQYPKQQMMTQPPRQHQYPEMMVQPPPQRQYPKQQQQMMTKPSPHYPEQQQPEMMVQPPPQRQYPKQQMMTNPSPHYHYPEEQQQEMMVQPPSQRQYPKQQQQMMAKPSPPRLLEPLPSAFGKKRAVLCGVDYRGKSYSLKGCISDAKSMRSLLVQQLGFPIDSILMFTEDETDPQRIPTKKNIRKGMRWLVEGNRARDSLVFHFSGHGSQQKDYNGDEIDGQDETICPLDHETEGKIIDDEINRLLVRPLVHGAKLHAIIDACNSGTVLDLPFVCRMERNGYYEWEDQRSVKAYKGTDGGSAFCFSACDDHESSGYTPVFTGKNAGTMTHSFIKAVKIAGPAPTYGHLLNLMCSAVREAQSRLTYTSSDTSAEPVLTSSEEFDVYTKKFLL